jgi:glycogen operon protein
MTEEDWESGFGRSIAVYLNGLGIPSSDGRGERVTDDSFYLCFSAHDEPIEFTVPRAEYAQSWQVEIDTMEPQKDDGVSVAPDAVVSVGPRAIVVLRAVS